MRRVIYLLATTLLAVAPFPQALKTKESAAARNTLFGKNLIVNGDAEMGETGEGNAKDWAPQSDVEIENYGHVAGEWDWNAPGAPNGGQNYFRIAIGGVAETKTVSQLIDVGGAAKEIDAGAAEFTASGHFGEIRSEHGTMILNVVFLDAADKTLGEAATAPG